MFLGWLELGVPCVKLLVENAALLVVGMVQIHSLRVVEKMMLHLAMILESSYADQPLEVGVPR